MQSARAAALAAEADEADLRGALIEYTLEVVDAALAALNESLASGARASGAFRGGGESVLPFLNYLETVF